MDDMEQSDDSGSPLISLFRGKASEYSPNRQDVLMRRDALLNAYRELMKAQQYRKPPVNDYPTWVAGATQLASSNDGNAQSFGKSELARASAFLDQFNRQRASEQDQAKTGLAMNNEGLDFLNKDAATEMKYLELAGNQEAKEEMIQLKRALLALQMNGNGGGDDQISDPIAVAQNLGVRPYTGPNPYAGLDKVGKRQLRMNFEKEVQKAKDDAAPAQEKINDMKRFLELNEAKKDDLVGTGSLAGAVPGMDFVRKKFDNDLNEMDSIASKITPQMRVAGSGSSSDLDVAMFKKATVGIDKPYEANKNIGAAYLINKQNEIDKANFLENYLAANGHTRGANKAWQDYLNANPIFKRGSKKFELNEKRTPWEKWFAGETEEPSDRDKALAELERRKKSAK